jgi:hypothetical protein
MTYLDDKSIKFTCKEMASFFGILHFECIIIFLNIVRNVVNKVVVNKDNLKVVDKVDLCKYMRCQL